MIINSDLDFMLLFPKKGCRARLTRSNTPQALLLPYLCGIEFNERRGLFAARESCLVAQNSTPTSTSITELLGWVESSRRLTFVHPLSTTEPFQVAIDHAVFLGQLDIVKSTIIIIFIYSIFIKKNTL